MNPSEPYSAAGEQAYINHFKSALGGLHRAESFMVLCHKPGGADDATFTLVSYISQKPEAAPMQFLADTFQQAINQAMEEHGYIPREENGVIHFEQPANAPDQD